MGYNAVMRKNPDIFNEPKLDFRTGASEYIGIKAASISSFGSNLSDIMFRELGQNSNDSASQTESKVSTIHVSREIFLAKDIPGMSEYKKALEAHVAHCKKSGGWNGKVFQVVNRIENSLKKDNLPILFVRDNGAGFGAEGFSAVLSDGLSNKKGNETSSGSFGNGHFTTFSASDLRYVWYGSAHRLARQKAVEYGCIGHAILGTHPGTGGNEYKSQNGYWAAGYSKEHGRPKPLPVTNPNQIPEFMMREINSIAGPSTNGTGAVVAVLAFNNFNQNDNLDMIEEAKRVFATHFYHAIYENKMKVLIKDGDANGCINKENLHKVLLKHKDNKWSPKGFPSGRIAWNAYNAIKEGERLSHGVCLCKHDAGDHLIAYCRNGMHITTKIDGRKNIGDKLRSKEPFNAVICFDENTADSETYRVLSTSEPNLHDALMRKELEKGEKKIFDKFIDGAIDSIDKKLADQETEECAPSDILPYVHGEKTGPIAGVDIDVYPSPPKPRPRPPNPHLPKPPSPDNPKPSPGPDQIIRKRRTDFEYRVGRISESKIRIVVEPRKDCIGMRFRLNVDVGQNPVDSPLSDGPQSWQSIKMRAVSTKRDGNEDRLFPLENGGKHANVGKISAGEKIILYADYEPPDIVGGPVINVDFWDHARDSKARAS